MTQEKGRNMYRYHQQLIKTNVNTVVSIYLFQNNFCIDCPIIHISYDTRQDAYHKGS
jgi:hypothetical protein